MRYGDGYSGKSRQVEPLRMAHGVAMFGARLGVSFGVTKSGSRGNGREEYGRVLHLAENFCAEEITLGARGDELIERDWIIGGCVRQIFAKHRADFRFASSDGLPE